jgi:hypothetical protein
MDPLVICANATAGLNTMADDRRNREMKNPVWARVVIEFPRSWTSSRVVDLLGEREAELYGGNVRRVYVIQMNCSEFQLNSDQSARAELKNLQKRLLDDRE